MSSKIKVNPRNFKIINQEKSIELSSDSESSTSVNSDTDSIKVIKLDDSLQSGGKGFQYQQQQPPQQPQQITVKKFEQPQQPLQPLKTSSFNQTSSNVLPQPPPSPPSPPPQSLPLPLPQKKNMEEYNYLRTPLESTNTSIESSAVENSDKETEETEETEEIPKENPEVEQNGSTDVIDLTKSQLHDVLYSIFTDVTGNNISENIEKMSKLFETHNQIMEKILSQLIIMNSNYKQVTVPEAMQTNTKQAKSLNDFRKTTENP